jgi:hypothetical protein
MHLDRVTNSLLPVLTLAYGIRSRAKDGRVERIRQPASYSLIEPDSWCVSIRGW